MGCSLPTGNGGPTQSRVRRRAQIGLEATPGVGPHVPALCVPRAWLCLQSSSLLCLVSCPTLPALASRLPTPACPPACRPHPGGTGAAARQEPRGQCPALPEEVGVLVRGWVRAVGGGGVPGCSLQQSGGIIGTPVSAGAGALARVHWPRWAHQTASYCLPSHCAPACPPARPPARLPACLPQL